MSRIMPLPASVLLLIVSLSVSVQAAEVVTFAAPPTETAAVGNELYAPMVKLLSKHTRKEVALRACPRLVELRQIYC